jgi:SAM-dependent methyltransferase
MRIKTHEKLRQALGAFREARVIQAAGKLRIFDYAAHFTPAQEISRSAGISPRGADILLDALAGLGLMIKKNGKYRNAPLTTKYLMSNSKGMTLQSIDHLEQLYRRWANLIEVTRIGAPVIETPQTDAERGESTCVFILAMHSNSFPRAKEMVELLDLKGVKRVLDAGGGPGSYLIALASKIPDLEGILIDQEAVLKIASELIKDHGLEKQIHLRVNDLFSGDGPFEQNMDLIILSSILHIEGPEQNLQLLKRLKASLRPGGRLIIHEFFLEDSGTEPQDAALFAVNMLVNTPRGRAWRKSDVRAWLKEAGFSWIEPLKEAWDPDYWIAG